MINILAWWFTHRQTAFSTPTVISQNFQNFLCHKNRAKVKRTPSIKFLDFIITTAVIILLVIIITIMIITIMIIWWRNKWVGVISNFRHWKRIYRFQPWRGSACYIHIAIERKYGKVWKLFSTKYKCELFPERLIIELFSLSLKLELPKLTSRTYPEMRVNKGGIVFLLSWQELRKTLLGNELRFGEKN